MTDKHLVEDGRMCILMAKFETLKYTVLCNYDEYADGLFDSEDDARSHMVGLIKESNPAELENLSDDEILEDNSNGYYNILHIITGIVEEE